MLFDTSAWIEFFQGTEKGKHVEDVLKSDENFTSVVTFAEITNWCIRTGQSNKIKEYIDGAKKGSQIIDLHDKITILAGEINFQRKKIEKNWGMMDSFILATARMYNLKILTKDIHFKDLPNAEIL